MSIRREVRKSILNHYKLELDSYDLLNWTTEALRDGLIDDKEQEEMDEDACEALNVLDDLRRN